MATSHRDQHGKNSERGTDSVDPATGELEHARPDKLRTWRVEVDYDPAATCPIVGDRPIISTYSGIRRLTNRLSLCGSCRNGMGAALIDKPPDAIEGVGVLGHPEILESQVALDNKPPACSAAPLPRLSWLDRRHPAWRHAICQAAAVGLARSLRRRVASVNHAVKSIITRSRFRINVKNGPVFTQTIHARCDLLGHELAAPIQRKATRAINHTA